jgi:hypothetical protein
VREPIPRESQLPQILYVRPIALLAESPPILALARRTHGEIDKVDTRAFQVMVDHQIERQARRESWTTSFDAAFAANRCPQCGDPISPDAPRALIDYDGAQMSDPFCKTECRRQFETESAFAMGAIRSLDRQQRDAEQQADDERARLEEEFARAQIAELLKDPDRLRTERDDLKQKRHDLVESKQRAGERLTTLHAHGLALRDDLAHQDDDARRAELNNLETASRSLFTKYEEIERALAEVEHDRPIVRRAWRAHRIRQRDERGGEMPPRFCLVCPKRLPLLHDADTCSPKCEAAAEADKAVWRWRSCQVCHRHFESDVRRVLAFADHDPYRDLDPFPWTFDVCSLVCWNVLAVDEDEPPVFDGVVYVAPHALTTNERAQPQGELLMRALPTLDRYVGYLREHGPATDAEAAAKVTGLPEGSIRRVRREHRALFVSDGGRPAQWRLA